MTIKREVYFGPVPVFKLPTRIGQTFRNVTMEMPYSDKRSGCLKVGTGRETPDDLRQNNAFTLSFTDSFHPTSGKLWPRASEYLSLDRINKAHIQTPSVLGFHTVFTWRTDLSSTN